MIAARQIAFGGSKRKPYDAEIEYLESTGTQYIDTKYTGSQCPYFSLDVQPLVTNVDASMIGAYTSGYSVRQYSSRWRWFENGWTLTNIPVDITRFTNITKNASGWFVDGEITQKSSVSSWNLSLAIFGSNNNGVFVAGFSPIRVKRLSFFDKESSLVADFIPVRVGDVGYMYDRVSGQLFGNAGTGAFVLGADIIDYTAKDYIQDGLVAIADAKDKLFTGGFKADMFDLSNGYLDNAEAIEMPNIIQDSSYVTLESVCGEITQGTTQNAYPFNLSREGKDKNPQFWVDGLNDTYPNWRVICPKDTSTNSYNFKKKSEIVYLFTLSIDPNRCYFYTNSKTEADFACFNDGSFVGLRLKPDSRRCVRIYSRTLSAEEIAYNDAIDRARFKLP